MEKETYHTKYHNEFQPGSNATIINDPVYHGTVFQGCGMQQAQTQHFPLCRNDKYLKQLYQFLVDDEWIDGATHPDNFVYLMGGLEQSPMVKPIEWKKTTQLLREMLEMVFEPVLQRGVIKKADLERIAPMCFTKGKKPISMYATGHVECWEYDNIVKFLSSIG